MKMRVIVTVELLDVSDDRVLTRVMTMEAGTVGTYPATDEALTDTGRRLAAKAGSAAVAGAIVARPGASR